MTVATIPPDAQYYHACNESRSVDEYQQALDRCIDRVRKTISVHGLRNPKIGRPDHTWNYCGPYDWVISFQSGQLWLAAQMTGDSVFYNAARARIPAFKRIIDNAHAMDHDLGFQFSLSCVADWKMTGSEEARALALRAADALRGRFSFACDAITAWNPRRPAENEHSRFVAGRIIADTMQNLALLHWAHRETGCDDYRAVADAHAHTALKRLIRADGSSYHTFVFDPASGEPLRGETYQGFAHESCWSRGQAWMIHGFAQTYRTTGVPEFLDAARRLASTAEALMGDDAVPPWDYRLAPGVEAHRDSSAGAIMAAGLYLLASVTEGAEADRWRAFGDRLLDGLLAACDLTRNPAAHGLLDFGAAYVAGGFHRNMLPYGDYYFMEALMRSLGHAEFFW